MCPAVKGVKRKGMSIRACGAVCASGYTDAQQLTGLKKEFEKRHTMETTLSLSKQPWQVINSLVSGMLQKNAILLPLLTSVWPMPMQFKPAESYNSGVSDWKGPDGHLTIPHF